MRPFVGDRIHYPVEAGGAHDHGRVNANSAGTHHQGRLPCFVLDLFFQLAHFLQRHSAIREMLTSCSIFSRGDVINDCGVAEV